MERKAAIIDENEALAQFRDGMTIVLGGFITTQHSMAIIRGLAKRGLKDLTVIGSLSASLDVDLLIGCGCVRRLVSAYVGAETAAPLGPFCKKAAEEDQIEIWECDEIIVAAMLKATAFGLPFFPVRGGLGTDLPKLNPDLKEFRDPINNEPLLAVPAMPIDVAVTHASWADQYGNVQYAGNSFVDGLMHRAAETTLTTVEKIVSPEEIRRDPFKTVYTADRVVRAPFGAHPYSCHGSYLEDEEHLTEYAGAAYMATQGDDRSWKEYRRRYIDDPDDHLAYLEEVGVRRLFSLNEY
ncbi:MAG: CoA transferase subunit A [Proteobacteria bacterium]|nr:CoA transferase subunit A [Pseudomonadota bacterium]